MAKEKEDKKDKDKGGIKQPSCSCGMPDLYEVMLKNKKAEKESCSEEAQKTEDEVEIKTSEKEDKKAD